MADAGGEEGDELQERLRKKTADLELAATIGQRLFEQNKELRTRNEFLEAESREVEETITQLRHELRLKVDLMHRYSMLDEYGERASTRENEHSLRTRAEKLADENRRLKTQNATLQQTAQEADQHGQKVIRDLNKQLDSANDKIHKLQRQIQEKQDECQGQALNVSRLMQEIQAKSRETKELTEVNLELAEQLDDAIRQHEALEGQVGELQEKYTEVKLMYSEAEEEIKSLKVKSSVHRTSSQDSMYDSLASELENSDSGFASTPFVTARSDAKSLRQELERLQNQPIREVEAVVEVPNPVLVDVLRRGVQNRPPTTPPQTPMSQIGPPLAHSTPAPWRSRRGSDDVPRKSTACIETQTDPPPCPEADVQLQAVLQNQHAQQASTSFGHPTVAAAQPLALTIVKTTVVHSIGAAHSRDATATPSIDVTTRPKTLNIVPRDEPAPPIVAFPGTSREAEKIGNVSKSSSTDSLADYVGPKMGEPGMPGTRDLDAAIRRLKVRRQVEADFAKFRERRGLPQQPFYAQNRPAASSVVATSGEQKRLGAGISPSQHNVQSKGTVQKAPIDGYGAGPLDRFCASCGTRRIVFFDRIHHAFRAHVPHILIGGVAVAAVAWFLLMRKAAPKAMIRVVR
ncbi:unnamed protein product, partial [Mesorhabditis spiculigera]